MLFWLGTHEPAWLSRLDVPLFVSRRRIARRKTLPKRARAPWGLDSGGFTELEQHGEWCTSLDEYVEEVTSYAEGIGQLAWAAPQDWMCEPFMLEKTGKTVREHQELTVQNFLDLRAAAPDLPFIPVLQGWELDDYVRCVDLYDQAGIYLPAAGVVGVGSVCRRQHTDEIGAIMRELASGGIMLHGFGVKKEGLAEYGRYLSSSDSMSWSYNARKHPAMEGCTHAHCGNCVRWALRWREQLLSMLSTTPEEDSSWLEHLDDSPLLTTSTSASTV